MNTAISIMSMSSISALGSSENSIWEKYQQHTHHILRTPLGKTTALLAKLPEHVLQQIQELKDTVPAYKNLDSSVLYAIYVSRIAMKNAGWSASDNFGINIGSSRGATALFEKHHESFLKKQVAETLSSPTTTLGNISSWVAHDLQTQGPEISHSITCSTALHALLNGVAWLAAGFSDKFLVGGSEAALTPFTIAQMNALKIYAQKEQDYPCRALDLEKKQNTLVLGEGAAVVCLEKGYQKNALATITGIGYATEVLTHSVSISAEGTCFQKSMIMAIGETPLQDIDAIVMHAPGTVKGDQSEAQAVKHVFGEHSPFLTTNKWKLGHTFATSGMLSVELAVLMLQHQQVIPVPFAVKQSAPKKIQKILVNAVGFGGNAVSVLIEKQS